MPQAKYTLIRWLNGQAVQAVVQEVPEALKTRRLWKKQPGNLSFKPYRAEDEQIVRFANQTVV